MAEWYDTIQNTIVSNAGEWWTYLVTGLLCWLDGFFPPLPSESIVIAMAALAETHGGPVQLWLLILVASAGAYAGDNTAFWLGRLLPLEKLFRGEKGAKLLAKATDLLERRGAVMLISARYVPGYRIAINMVAGTVGMPWKRFASIVVFSTLLWASFSVGIGLAAGSLFHDRPLLGIIVGVALGLMLGWIVERVGAIRERNHMLRAVGLDPREERRRLRDADGDQES